jgi:hypothetical protein
MDDEKTFKQNIMDKIKEVKDFKKCDENEFFSKVSINNKRMFDLNDRDLGLFECEISNIPRNNNHFGSLCYYASIITAIGRSLIVDVINRAVGNVYYADTDSIILDEEAF